MNQAHLADEQAAWKAVHEFRKSTTPIGSSDAEDFTIGDRESKMLGTAAGEAITKILAGDKVSKGKEKARDTNQKMTSGVPLWISSSDEDMEVDPMSIPSLSGHPILTCLDGLVRSGDDSVLDLILRSGALAAVPRDILLSNIPRLLDMAMFASSQIAEAVCIALRDLWGLNPHKVQMPFAAILFAFVRLGASPSILEGLGWVTEHAQKKNDVAHETLLEALKRLLAIVKAAGCASAFSRDDVANVVLILVLMGLDPLTSSELRTQLNATIDAVCNHGTTDYLFLSVARQLLSVNKARLVSFFASGSGRTRYIARRLAYHLLVSVPGSLDVQALPLEPLILLLSPDAGSCELFDVTNESTDYEELRHYVHILSVALVDIAPYVEEECAIKSACSTLVPGSPNKTKKSPVPPLELLRGVLDVLQGKIVDTRAAHLDRSRIKAAIQRLTLRIHYDRMALVDARPRRRASTLNAYFSPQRQ
ncbi:hypothetical protein EV363DRAFT_1320858 [Boletus edulis]|nr:hypothetical protein EV363DRAFT_1320858 [Boletus edulis]